MVQSTEKLDLERVLSVRQTAAVLQVNESTVRSEIAAGRLRASRVGRQLRLRPDDISAYLDRLVVGARA